MKVILPKFHRCRINTSPMGFSCLRQQGMNKTLKNAKKPACILLTVLLVTVFTLFLAVSSYGGEENSEDQLAFLSEPGVRIGVSNGSIQEYLVSKMFPEAELFYMEKFSGYEALSQGKIDAYVYDKKQMELAIKNGLKGVKLLDQTLGDPTKIALGISDISMIPDLEGEVNRFIGELKADGTLDDMYERWVINHDFEMPEIEEPVSVRCHLMVGTTGDVEPYSFYESNALTGYDIELMHRLAAYLEADLEFMTFDWDSIVNGLKSGKIDIIASNLQMSPERAEEITFSDILYLESNGVMVRDTESDGAGDNTVSKLLSSVKDSFEKTFIKEDRYKLFLSGILTTIFITVLSIILGTFFGFLIFMACRKGNRIANAFARIFDWFVQGIPTVVLLMILYYIVFAGIRIRGDYVAVMGFTMFYASIVYNMLKTGVGAVEKGQTEAAYALGYGDIHAFFRMILPQALPHFLPAYKAQVVALIKATAVVGYIAVLDLTKIGDIVRGRTYDAFFPLISVAVIYFILEWILTTVVKRIERSTDPKMRSPEDILKRIMADD